MEKLSILNQHLIHFVIQIFTAMWNMRVADTSWHSQFWVLVWLERLPFAPQKRMKFFCDFVVLFWIDFWRLRGYAWQKISFPLASFQVSHVGMAHPLDDFFFSLDRAPWVPKWVKIAASLDGRSDGDEGSNHHTKQIIGGRSMIPVIYELYDLYMYIYSWYFNGLLSTYESCARPRRTWWAALQVGP